MKKIYEIDRGLFPEASSTFHGRDIFAPVAAGLASGKKPEEFGYETEEMVTHTFPGYTPGKNVIEGRVLHLDRFGNVITSIPSHALDLKAKRGISVSCKSGDFPVKYTTTYGDLSGGDAGVLSGSSGFLELSMNMKPLAREKEIQVEEEIKIHYE
jgi:S-adenosylmethionine hydrolase